MADEPTKPPKVFISYAWEEDVKPWVLALARQLRKDGVEAVLDQWETHYGDQLPEFMEKAVRESSFVIVVCTPVYKEKSDKRVGGVGYEGHIITSEILQNSTHRKFIPVLRKGSWGSALPSWAAGKLSMDLSGNPYSKKNYQELLRVLHGKWYTPPPIGKPPDFPDEEDDDTPPIAPRKPLVSKDDVDKFIVSLRNFGRKLFPLFKVAGILFLVGALFWAGSLAVPKFIALVPTPQATATATQRPVVEATSTNAPVSPTLTLKPNPTPTKTLIPAPTSLPTEITDAKGITMHLVPEGEFTMGSENGEDDERPVHQVYVEAFYIDIYEVTNAAYEACVTVGGCTSPQDKKSYTRSSYYGNSQYDNYPVIHVDWNQANTYCEWRGASLPTEAQWEKAARGTDGRTYPWGNTFDGTKVNFCDKNCLFGWADKTVNDGYEDTSSVGSYESGKSLYGIYDLAGNVREWVSSLYKPYPYVLDDGRENLNDSGSRVLRGGSWNDFANNVRSSARDNFDPVYFLGRTDNIINFFNSLVGFRCAKDADAIP